jgi:hypothetical protein
MHHTRVIRAAEKHETVGTSVGGCPSLLADKVAMKVYAVGVNAAKTLQAFSVSIAMVESGSIIPGPDEGMKDEALTLRYYWSAKPLQQERRTFI